MYLTYVPVAQLDRVSDSDSEGRAFESHRAYQSWKKLFPFGEVSSNPYMTHFLNFAIRMSL